MDRSPYNDNPPPYSETANDEKAKASAPPSWGTNGHPPPPPPPHYPHQSYGAVTMEPVAVPVTQVILVGGCPACRVGVLEDSYSLVGVLCAILFFPLGILCCLAMRERRCTNCGAVF